MTLTIEHVAVDAFTTRNWKGRRRNWYPERVTARTAPGTNFASGEASIATIIDLDNLSSVSPVNTPTAVGIASQTATVFSSVIFSDPNNTILLGSSGASFSPFGGIYLFDYPDTMSATPNATFHASSSSSPVFEPSCRLGVSTISNLPDKGNISGFTGYSYQSGSEGQISRPATSGTYFVAGSSVVPVSTFAAGSTSILINPSTAGSYDKTAPSSPSGLTTDHDQLENAIHYVFNIDPMPEFEDGVNNLFSAGIEHVVRKFGNEGVRELHKVFWNTRYVSCVGEALRRFGLIENETTTEERFQTLIALLKHRSPVVRDGAIIGLAYLDDPRAIGPIEEAIRTEPVPALRCDMEAIREQLAHR